MVSPVEAVSASVLEASPRADAAARVGAQVVGGVVARVLDGLSFWSVLLSLVAGAVLWDQCEFFFLSFVFLGGMDGLMG